MLHILTVERRLNTYLSSERGWWSLTYQAVQHLIHQGTKAPPVDFFSIFLALEYFWSYIIMYVRPTPHKEICESYPSTPECHRMSQSGRPSSAIPPLKYQNPSCCGTGLCYVPFCLARESSYTIWPSFVSRRFSGFRSLLQGSVMGGNGHKHTCTQFLLCGGILTRVQSQPFGCEHVTTAGGVSEGLHTRKIWSVPHQTLSLVEGGKRAHRRSQSPLRNRVCRAFGSCSVI